MGRKKGAIVNDRSFSASHLREELKPVFEALAREGVSEEDLPSNERVLAKLFTFIDDEKVNAWAKDYADWAKKKP